MDSRTDGRLVMGDDVALEDIVRRVCCAVDGEYNEVCGYYSRQARTSVARESSVEFGGV